MKSILILLFTVGLLLSCASQDVYKQRMFNSKEIVPGIAVNSYGQVKFIGDRFSCQMLGPFADYSSIKKDIMKAKEWDSQPKSSSLQKSINTYTDCSLKIDYIYSKPGDTSYIKICYQNPMYRTIIDTDCIDFADYDAKIAALENVPAVMKILNTQIDAGTLLK